MKNLKFFLFISLSLFFSTKSISQYYYYNDRYYDKDLIVELGLGAGGMNCVTDVGGANTDSKKYLNEINLNNTRPCYSVFGEVMYQNFIGGRLEATWGRVTSGRPRHTRRRFLQYHHQAQSQPQLQQQHC